MAAADSKIAVYSLPDLKNTTDDALPNYLNSLGFQQTHLLADVRLGLGYSAVIIAGALFAYDYKFGWEASKPYTWPAVIAYFVLNGAFTAWILFAEKGKIYNGELRKILFSVASDTKKHTPLYKLTVRSQDNSRIRHFDWEILEIEAPFTTWFTADGHFVAKPFQVWLCSSVPMIAKAAEVKALKAAAKSSSVAETSGVELGAGVEATPRTRKSKG